MKTRFNIAESPRILLVLVGLFSCSWLAALAGAQTFSTPRSFYINDDGFLFVAEGTNQVMDAAHIAASRQAPDCQPAENDPAGNWGFPSDGRQLSIRFDKPAYRSREPIAVDVIVRNASASNVNYYFFGAPNALFQFLVTNERGEEIQTVQDRQAKSAFAKALSKSIVNDPKLATVVPGTQRKHTLEFSRFYALDPGTYYILAWVRYFDEGNPTRQPEIRSGTAKLQIVESGGDLGARKGANSSLNSDNSSATSQQTTANRNTGTAGVRQQGIVSWPSETKKPDPAAAISARPGNESDPITVAATEPSHALSSPKRLVTAIVGFAVFGLLLVALLRRRRS